MPALWPASQKPMYIRTVWVGGFRHAILSEDDPYYVKRNRRPHSSTTCTSKHNSTRNRNKESLEDCLKKLNLAISTDKAQTDRDDFNIERLDLNEFEEDIVLKANQQPLCEYDTNRIKFTNFDDMKTLRSNRTARTEVHENSELSERVLQWLDLAGKEDLLSPCENERISQPRHSWPEIQRRNQNIVKSKTAIDLRIKESKPGGSKVIDSAREQPHVNIDRHDLYMTSSANTIETYARRSRNVKSTPAGGGHARPKADKNKTNIQTNVSEARKRLASERNAVEKQYTDLVSKKIIPDLGKSTKKQVHIFMPEGISKKINSTSTSRTESLLTQKS